MSENSFQAVGILLCGGRGRRFDPTGEQDKLLQTLPSGERVAQASACALRQSCARVVAVLRPDSATLKKVLLESGCEVVECADADLGMSATLRAGLLHASQADAWLIALADMPWLQASTYQALWQALAEGAEVVAPFHEGKRGNPVGFGRACLPELLALEGDQGARTLIARPGLRKVPVEDAGILRDIDTPADLLKP